MTSALCHFQSLAWLPFTGASIVCCRKVEKYFVRVGTRNRDNLHSSVLGICALRTGQSLKDRIVLFFLHKGPLGQRACQGLVWGLKGVEN